MRPETRSSGHSHRHAKPTGAENPFTGPWPQSVPLLGWLLLLGVCMLGGGSSFADTVSLLYLRPFAMLSLLLFLLVPGRPDWRTYRGPLVLLAAWAMLMAVQLVPLPPSIWTVLPGRLPYVGVAQAAGMAQPWRPWSLTPDLTANSLAALVVPAAVLVGFTRLTPAQRDVTVLAIIVLCCISAVLGVAQFAGGKDSFLYLYQRTYPGSAVGLLANRNHHATLLSILFPALRWWTLTPTANRVWERNRQWLALGIGVLTIPVVLATGSRAGLILMVLGIIAAFLVFPGGREGHSPVSGWRRHFGRVGLPLVAVALVGLSVLLGRAASIERLVALSAVDSDQRFQFAPTVLRVIRETFPAGTGFGSFDPVFRQYEPDSILISSYFNHAHNELLEIVVMAGLPGILFLIGFLLWWCLRTWAAARGSAGRQARLGRLGSLAVAFVLLASLVDYPLRAPLMAAVFATASAWLCARNTAERPASVVTTTLSG